jgi:uncharacterized protein
MAVQWYRKAAEQGDKESQFHLARLYKDGKGVIQDNVGAHMWFNISAALGKKESTKGRDAIAKMMTSTDISEAQRRARVCMKSKYKDCD